MYARRLLYMEDRADQVKAGRASTWQRDRNCRDVQLRLDALARNYEKDFKRYARTMLAIYGPDWHLVDDM